MRRPGSRNLSSRLINTATRRRAARTIDASPSGWATMVSRTEVDSSACAGTTLLCEPTALRQRTGS